MYPLQACNTARSSFQFTLSLNTLVCVFLRFSTQGKLVYTHRCKTLSIGCFLASNRYLRSRHAHVFAIRGFLIKLSKSIARVFARAFSRLFHNHPIFGQQVGLRRNPRHKLVISREHVDCITRTCVVFGVIGVVQIVIQSLVHGIAINQE